MPLAEDKINQIAHRIQNTLEADALVRVSGGRDTLLRGIKRALIAELKQDELCDAVVRQRLASYSRKIIEGSPEWDILYHKTFHEEMRRRGRT